MARTRRQTESSEKQRRYVAILSPSSRFSQPVLFQPRFSARATAVAAQTVLAKPEIEPRNPRGTID
ncbi:hypothetical protein KY285_019487 [Solanum tuberosum]|nr:hypothetical protein KY285_019487 [Solanum tuberosum]